MPLQHQRRSVPRHGERQRRGVQTTGACHQQTERMCRDQSRDASDVVLGEGRPLVHRYSSSGIRKGCATSSVRAARSTRSSR